MSRIASQSIYRIILSLAVGVVSVSGSASAQMTLDVADYATAPITGKFGGTGNASALARINFIRPEPRPQGRLFVNDLNGPLYILDPATRTFTKYLDLNGRSGASGIFKRFSYAIDL